VAATGCRLSEYLQRTAPDGATQCTWCGTEVAPPGTDWKDHAVVRRVPVDHAGPLRTGSDEFTLVQACCPGCGTLLDTELAAAGDAPLHDRVRRWPTA
jgi:acetone carboxylase gamma subunit